MNSTQAANLDQVTNSNVFDDWAGAERRAGIARIPQMRSDQRVSIGGIKASQIWMNDVSAEDSRSVKAWLAGRGDTRVVVWHLKSLLGLIRGDTIDADVVIRDSAAPAKERVAAAVQRYIGFLAGATETV